jgi:hypothetical protein
MAGCLFRLVEMVAVGQLAGFLSALAEPEKF